MKTKTLTLRIKVPDWFPGSAYWRRVKTTWNTVKFKFRPYRCIDCGTRMNFRFPQFSHKGAGKDRLMVSHHGHNLTNDPRGGVCGHCLAIRIRGLFSRTTLTRGWGASNSPTVTYHSEGECACCKQEKKTISGSWDEQCNIRFGTAWWNGFDVCEDCLTEAVEKGTQSSSMSAWFGDKSYPINQAGAVIGLDKWYRLLVPLNKPHTKAENEDKTTVG